MPALHSKEQVGKRESLADLISIIEAEGCPLTSMLNKRKRPNQEKNEWQIKKYPVTGHEGVLDRKDVDNFTSNPRVRVAAMAQKTWHNPGVSDFSEEAEVAGLSKGEMAEQISDALVTVKRQIEKRCLSDAESQEDNGQVPNETRGAFKWVESAAQSHFPVPDGYRTSAGNIYTGTLVALTEDVLIAMCNSAYLERNGPSNLKGFVGVALKAHISNYTRYDSSVVGKESVRMFNQDAGSKAVINCVDILKFDTGKINLLLAPFLLTHRKTGERTAASTMAGLFIDPTMWGLAYTRMPRVRRLEDQGGGPRAIVDAIFMLMCDNPQGHLKVVPSAAS